MTARPPWRVHLQPAGGFAVGTSAYVVSGVLTGRWERRRLLVVALGTALGNAMAALGPTYPLLLSLNASAIYLGSGLAGLPGGVVVQAFGVLALAPVAAVVGLAALGIVLLSICRTAAPVASYG